MSGGRLFPAPADPDHRTWTFLFDIWWTHWAFGLSVGGPDREVLVHFGPFQVGVAREWVA